jgi:hypothetical protein
MKVDIKTNIGRGDDPAPTIAHYVRARWGKGKVILTGKATCQGKTWNVRHTYFFETFLKQSKEEILKDLFPYDYIGGK